MRANGLVLYNPLLRFSRAGPDRGFGVIDPGFVKIAVSLRVPDRVRESVQEIAINGRNVITKRDGSAFSALVL